MKKYIIIGMIILGVIGVSFGSVKASEYRKVNKLTKEADQLTKSEDYELAIKKLELTQDKWTSGGNRKRINNYIEENKKLLIEKRYYDQGIAKFDEGKWQEAEFYLAKIDILSLRYNDAQKKIDEAKQKIALAEEEKKKLEQEEEQKRLAEEEQKKQELAKKQTQTVAYKPKVQTEEKEVKGVETEIDKKQKEENKIKDEKKSKIQVYLDQAVPLNSNMDSLMSESHVSGSQDLTQVFSNIDRSRAKALNIKGTFEGFSPPDECSSINSYLRNRASNLVSYLESVHNFFLDTINSKTKPTPEEIQKNFYYNKMITYQELQKNNKEKAESEIDRIKSEYGL